MPSLLRRPVSAGARPCQGRSSLDMACAPAEHGSYRKARTGMISQIKVSTLQGEPRADLVWRMGNVELDRTSAARLEIDEEQAVSSNKEVAGMRLAVKQLLGVHAAHRLPSAAQCF